MMRLLGVTLVALVLLQAPALAEPPLHLQTARNACHLVDLTDCITLGPGYVLTNEAFSALDVEMRRLQDQETRLTAENVSLKKSAQGWQPGWKTLLISFAIGAGLAVYVERKI